MAKDAYFFPHDCNARNDPKILAMRSVYGSAGYGWYWMIIEMFREEESHRLYLNKYTYDALAIQMQCDRSTVEKYIADCCTEFKNSGSTLLTTDGEFLWSDAFLRRMKLVDIKREKARESAIIRWKTEHSENGRKPKVKRSHSEGNAIKERGEGGGK